ncbi:cell division protein FtsA [Aurantibacillus circumpalustris]|uniref:cell division protein FtsA n=1 Tax=Aurantibacillus circumpalustris TaxID=3036359 RepID=UPI00295C01DD|nr:cell division protein FtsA [Aurantibacillus circumpalustris]
MEKKTTPTNPNLASELVVGLDLGTTKIAAIVGRKNEFGKVEILGIGKSESLGVNRGVVVNIEQTVASIKTAVAMAADKANVDIGEVIVGIAGQHIKSMQHRGMITRQSLDDEVNQKDIDNLIDNMHRLVMSPGEEIIHVIPQEYIIDSESGIKNPIGHAGIRLEGNFHIITGQVSAVKNIFKCVDRAGLQTVDLHLEPLASADAVLSDEEKEAGVVLIDIGGGTTDVAIFYDGIIRHTAVIPFGGNIITDDIKEGCGIIKTQAEQLKMKFGSALSQENQENEIISIPGLRGRPHKEISVKFLAQIIQARMEEILEFVLFEIKSSGFERKLAAGIVVTGGGSLLKHLPQLVMLTTGMDCRIGTPNEHLAGNDDELKNPLFATGVGLVMKGIEKYERDSKRGSNLAKQEVEVEVESSASKKKDSKKVIGHSQKKIGSFFTTLIDRTKDWMSDDIE